MTLKVADPKAATPANAGIKRKYTFTPAALAAMEARRVKKQMKTVTTGVHAPAYDISDDVKVLPTKNGACVRRVPHRPILF